MYRIIDLHLRNPGDAIAHSTLIPAALMFAARTTLAHFSVSGAERDEAAQDALFLKFLSEERK